LFLTYILQFNFCEHSADEAYAAPFDPPETMEPPQKGAVQADHSLAHH